MTQSVVEKTSIPEKTWRRQTDSPSGWITFACGSLILHLLAFWLISLHKLSASQSGSDFAVPIEFIEISPQKSSPVQPQAKPKPKPKAVIPKPAKPILPQNSQPAALPNVVKPPVIVNDRDAIAFNNQKIEQKLAEQQRQQELLQQQQLAEQQRQRQAQQEQLEAQLRQQQTEQQQKLAEQQRQQEQADEQRRLQAQRQQEQADEQRRLQAQLQQEQADEQRRLQAQRQQEQADEQRRLQAQRQQEQADEQRQLQAQLQQEQADEQRRLAQQSKLEAEEQRKIATEQQPQNPADGEKITTPILDRFGETAKEASVNQQTPDSPVKDNRNEQIPLDQNQKTQLNQSSGILTASLKVDTNTFFKDKPANLAKPQKRINSDIPLPPPKDGNLQLGSFLVWLTIDNEGNLLSIEVDKQIPLAQRSQYQEYAEIIFNGQKFIPASEDNGNKPDLSYLPIRINIQSSSN